MYTLFIGDFGTCTIPTSSLLNMKQVSLLEKPSDFTNGVSHHSTKKGTILRPHNRFAMLAFNFEVDAAKNSAHLLF